MAVLYPYQEIGVQFLLERPAALNRKPHRLLADDPGLGKSAQAIVAAKRLGAKSGLICCTASIKYNWARQMMMWGLCKAEDIYIVKTRKDTIPADAKWVICNYDLAIVPHIYKQLKARKWAVAILDEMHKLKAFTSQRSRRILGREGVVHNCFYKFLLSGTPIPNRPIEFYTVLSTLVPEILKPFQDYYQFGKRFCKGFFDRYEGWNFKGASHIDELKERLKPFMLRREMRDVYKELPPVVDNVVYLDVYREMMSHPETDGLENPLEMERELPGATVRRIVGECKQTQALEYILNLLELHPKVMVFAYHRGVIEFLTRELALREINPITIYGGINAEKKQWLVDRFVDDPTIRGGVAQVNAAGEGVDGLQHVCNVMVFVEMDWCPGVMGQVRGRLVRIGQKLPVLVHYLVAEGTLDTVIASVLERKSAVIDEIMKGDPVMSIESQLDAILAELKTLNGNKGAKAAAATEEKADKPAKGNGKKDKETKSKLVWKDVRDAAHAFINANKDDEDIKAKASKIVKALGASNLADLENHPDQWEAAIAKFKSGPEDEDTGSDDDDLGI